MDFLNGSFRVGRLFGITIRVHILFVVYIAFRLMSSGENWQFHAWFMGLLFGTVLLHEFGHCFGARSVGGDAENILMWPLGGLAYAHAPMTPWAQFVTVACGPLVNLVFCVISGAFIWLQTGMSEILFINPFKGIWIPPDGLGLLGFALIFYQVNLLLLGFNLLPIYPLDGGQLFQTIIWPFVGLQRATLYSCQLGLVGCVFFGAWGLSGGGGSMLIFIAIFGGFTCWQRLQALRYGMVVDERVDAYGYAQRSSGGGFWRRIFKLKPRQRRAEPSNPNPGGWERKQRAEQKLEDQLDGILKKVHEHGVQSLSYVEQQVLSRATAERKKREQEFDRQKRL